MSATATTIGLAFLILSGSHGLSSQEAFEILKGLEGRWEGHVTEPGGPAGAVEYRVTSGGNTIMEVTFPGTEHEMISMYFLDEGELRVRHYCAMGNQPEMKLDAKSSTAETLRFVFTGGTNLDPDVDVHIHGGTIGLKGERLENVFAVYENGKETAGNKFFLKRAK